MDVDSMLEPPGGDDFVDVTEAFEVFGRDVPADGLLFQDGYNLYDAMAAFEIGEPRMDSGMIVEAHPRAPFNPLLPLLPQEVLWIIDRSFSCEMEWHAGLALSQTVYTFLYVHALNDMDPEFVPPQADPDFLRPRALITSVLRASVMGLMKCCDLAWRELSRSRVYEIEDWQGEKAEVSLLEGINADFILDELEGAIEWLESSTLPLLYVHALTDRLLLRKIILQLFKLTPPNPANIRGLVEDARLALGSVLVSRVEPPPPDSTVYQVFDPHITRTLPNFLPVRTAELPSQRQTWLAIEKLLDDWAELAELLEPPRIAAWEIAGTLNAWSLRKPLQCAYIRSLTQTMFFDRLVMGRFPPAWLTERFFFETCGFSSELVASLVEKKCSDRSVSWSDVERQIIKLLITNIRCHWGNQPRRRRHLMKAILDWHRLQTDLETLLEPLDPEDPAEYLVRDCAPKIAMHMRLSASREIILSGFQQELYAPDEVPIAYWFAGTVMEVHLECLHELLDKVSIESASELHFQYDFLTGLKYMCMAMGILTASRVAAPSRRLSLNFRKRYKWLFRPEFDELPEVRPGPDVTALLNILHEEEADPDNAPSLLFALAESQLQSLVQSKATHTTAGQWEDKRIKFVRRLAESAAQLRDHSPQTPVDLHAFDQKRLRWDPAYHPWFPSVVA